MFHVLKKKWFVEILSIRTSSRFRIEGAVKTGSSHESVSD